MAVEIVILSGERRGQRYETDQHLFRIGATPLCELLFDAQLDPGAKEREVSFRLSEDGWTARSTGAGNVLVNNTASKGHVHVRSGDIIRLSPLGPDFTFNILARPAAASTSFATQLASLSQQSTSAAPIAAPAESAPNPAPSVSAGTQPLIWVAVAGFTLIVAFAGWHLMGSKTTPEVPISEAPTASASLPVPKSHDDPTTSSVAVPSTKSTAAPPAPIDPTTGSSAQDNALPAAVAPVDRWGEVLENLRKSTFLLTVEQANGSRMWPFATACAVGDNMLLTSATVTTELAEFQRKGFKLWAINESLGIKTEIKKLRVNTGFLPDAGPAEKRIYFDLGILTVSETLTALATVAGIKDVSELEQGFPLGCVDMDIPAPTEIEAMNRFQHFQAEMRPCKVFAITSLAPPDGPRLLYLKGDLTPKPYGGMLIGQDGKVYAVFAETSEPEANSGVLVLHYAPVVFNELIEKSKSSDESEIWVAPVVLESPAPKVPQPAKDASPKKEPPKKKR